LIAEVLVTVALLFIVNEVFATMAVTRELFGMPVPVTNMPTARPVVLASVTVGLPLVVPQPVSLSDGPCTIMPAASDAVLAQVTVVLPVVWLLPLLSVTPVRCTVPPS